MPLPRTVGISRAFVRDDLRAWGVGREDREKAELLVSELTTNAVETSGLTTSPLGLAEPVKLIGIRLRLLAHSLCIEVWDSTPGLPLPRDPAPGGENGWGLLLVDALSVRWGFSEYWPGSKVVWCRMSLSGKSGLKDKMPLGPPLPRRRARHRRVPSADVMNDPAVLRHVLAGLRALEAEAAR